LAGSIIGDLDAYARAVEREYRALWGQWCNKRMSGRSSRS
jgi:hypothetical protein